MSTYVSCPCGKALMAPDRGKSRVYCLNCRKWVIVQNGIAVGYA